MPDPILRPSDDPVTPKKKPAWQIVYERALEEAQAQADAESTNLAASDEPSPPQWGAPSVPANRTARSTADLANKLSGRTIKQATDEVKRAVPGVSFSTVGQGNVHQQRSWDHSNAADVAVNPNSETGRKVMAELDRMGIPYLPSTGNESWSTGPHIHMGDKSKRTATPIARGTVGTKVYASAPPIPRAQPQMTPDEWEADQKQRGLWDRGGSLSAAQERMRLPGLPTPAEILTGTPTEKTTWPTTNAQIQPDPKRLANQRQQILAKTGLGTPQQQAENATARRQETAEQLRLAAIGEVNDELLKEADAAYTQSIPVAQPGGGLPLNLPDRRTFITKYVQDRLADKADREKRIEAKLYPKLVKAFPEVAEADRQRRLELRGRALDQRKQDLARQMATKGVQVDWRSISDEEALSGTNIGAGVNEFTRATLQPFSGVAKLGVEAARKISPAAGAKADAALFKNGQFLGQTLEERLAQNPNAAIDDEEMAALQRAEKTGDFLGSVGASVIEAYPAGRAAGVVTRALRLPASVALPVAGAIAGGAQAALRPEVYRTDDASHGLNPMAWRGQYKRDARGNVITDAVGNPVIEPESKTNLAARMAREAVVSGASARLSFRPGAPGLLAQGRMIERSTLGQMAADAGTEFAGGVMIDPLTDRSLGGKPKPLGDNLLDTLAEILPELVHVRGIRMSSPTLQSIQERIRTGQVTPQETQLLQQAINETFGGQSPTTDAPMATPSVGVSAPPAGTQATVLSPPSPAPAPGATTATGTTAAVDPNLDPLAQQMARLLPILNSTKPGRATPEQKASQTREDLAKAVEMGDARVIKETAKAHIASLQQYAKAVPVEQRAAIYAEIDALKSKGKGKGASQASLLSQEQDAPATTPETTIDEEVTAKLRKAFPMLSEEELNRVASMSYEEANRALGPAIDARYELQHQGRSISDPELERANAYASAIKWKAEQHPNRAVPARPASPDPNRPLSGVETAFLRKYLTPEEIAQFSPAEARSMFPNTKPKTATETTQSAPAAVAEPINPNSIKTKLQAIKERRAQEGAVQSTNVQNQTVSQKPVQSPLSDKETTNPGRPGERVALPGNESANPRVSVEPAIPSTARTSAVIQAQDTKPLGIPERYKLTRELGYSAEDLKAMTPQRGREILAQNEAKPKSQIELERRDRQFQTAVQQGQRDVAERTSAALIELLSARKARTKDEVARAAIAERITEIKQTVKGIPVGQQPRSGAKSSNATNPQAAPPRTIRESQTISAPPLSRTEDTTERGLTAAPQSVAQPKPAKRDITDRENAINLIRKNGGIRVTENNQGEFNDLGRQYPGLLSRNGIGEDQMIDVLRSEGYDIPAEPGALASFLSSYKHNREQQAEYERTVKEEQRYSDLGKNGYDLYDRVASGDETAVDDFDAYMENVLKFPRDVRQKHIEEAQQAGIESLNDSNRNTTTARSDAPARGDQEPDLRVLDLPQNTDGTPGNQNIDRGGEGTAAPRGDDQPDSIRATADTRPSAEVPSDVDVERPSETDLLERRRQQSLVAERADIRAKAQAKQKDTTGKEAGEYGKLKWLAWKQLVDLETGELHEPLVYHPAWKETLDLPPDASEQDVFNAIAQELAGQPMASLMTPKDWLGVADQFGPTKYSDLRQQIDNMVAHFGDFQKRIKKFAADEAVETALRQLETLPPNGQAARTARAELLRHLESVGINEQTSTTNLTDSWIKHYVAERIAHRSTGTPAEQSVSQDTQGQARKISSTEQGNNGAEPPESGNPSNPSQANRGDDAEQRNAQLESQPSEQSQQQVESSPKQGWQMTKEEFAASPLAHRVPPGILTLHPKEMTAEKLNQYSNRELEALSLVMALPKSGTKAEKVARLADAAALRLGMAEETQESLMKLKNAELIAMAKRAGIYYGGNKYSLATGLINWRTGARNRGKAALAEANHYNQVERALFFGKDVPEEVLKQYPDLQKEVAQKKTESAPLFTNETERTIAHQRADLDGAKVVAETENNLVVERADGTETLVKKDSAHLKPPREFSSTQVDVTGDLAKKILAFGQKIPDSELAEDGREDKPHITVKFGLHDDAPDAVRELLASEKPITATLGKVSIFPAKEDGEFDVVKVDVESPDLHRLNQKISKSRPVTDMHPTYKPHVTIAYVKPGEGKKYVGDATFEGQKVSFESVTFSSKNREKIAMPLGQMAEPTENIPSAVAKPENNIPQKSSADFESQMQSLGNGWSHEAAQRLDEKGKWIVGSEAGAKIDQIQYRVTWKEKGAPPANQVKMLEEAGWVPESRTTWITPLVPYTESPTGFSTEDLSLVRSKFNSLKAESDKSGQPIASAVEDFLNQTTLFGEQFTEAQAKALREMATKETRSRESVDQGSLFESTPTPESKLVAAQEERAKESERARANVTDAPLFGQQSVTPETAPLIKPESPAPKSTAPQERSVSELLGELEKGRTPELSEKERAAVEARRTKYENRTDAKAAADIAQLDRLLGKTEAPMGIVIEDFGEKIGGARKDTARPLGPKTTTKEKDERPVWLRKYHVAEIAKGYQQGKFEIVRDDEGTRQFFDTREAAEKAIPLYEAARKHGIHNIAKRGEEPNYAIYRKVAQGKYPVVREGFKTAEEAKIYLAMHPEEIIEHKFQEPQRPWLDSITRTGTERRTGDVDPKQFQKEFGFRGGEFGNWNKGGDGQAAINYAYDAMHDLAEVLGLPPEALSLGGQLSVAFGARGHGGKDAASAHYERGRAVINLTKIRGAGSLAHEWFHAVDHYTAQVDGKAAAERQADGTFSTKGREEYATHGFGWKSQAQKELVESFTNLVRTMTKKSVERVPDISEAQRVVERQGKFVQETLDDIRRNFLYDASRYKKRFKAATPEQIQKFNELSAKIADGDVGQKVYVKSERSRFGGYETYPVIQELDALFKSVQGRGILRVDHDSLGRILTARIDTMFQARERVGQSQQGKGEVKTVGTDYFNNARELDKTRVSDYFSTPHELGARAFESYIYDKIREQGNRSDYLVHGVENKYYLEGKPYPEGAEREQINAAFDRFFETARKLNQEAGYLSKAAAQARQRISDTLQGKQLNDVTQVIGDLAVVGADYLYRGVRSFAQWSRAIVGEFGPKVSPYIAKLWAQSKSKLQALLINSGIAEPIGTTKNDGSFTTSMFGAGQKTTLSEAHQDALAALLPAKSQTLPDAQKYAKDAAEKLVEAYKNQTLPLSRAIKIAQRLKAEGRVDALRKRQAQFVSDTIDLINQMVLDHATVQAMPVTDAKFTEATRRQKLTMLRLKNNLSKAGEYTKAYEYPAKIGRAMLLAAGHIVEFNIVNQVADALPHELSKLMPAPTKWLKQATGGKIEAPRFDLDANFKAAGAVLGEFRDLLADAANKFENPKSRIAQTFAYGESDLLVNQDIALDVYKQMHKEAKLALPKSLQGGAEKFELGNREKGLGVISEAINAIHRLHGAADVPGRLWAYTNALTALAHQQAKAIGKEHKLEASQVKELTRQIALNPSPSQILVAASEANNFVLDVETTLHAGFQAFKQKLTGMEKLRIQLDAQNLTAEEKKQIEATMKTTFRYKAGAMVNALVIDNLVMFAKIPTAGAVAKFYRYTPLALFGSGLKLRQMAKDRKAGFAIDPIAAIDAYRNVQKGAFGTLAGLVLGALGAWGWYELIHGDDNRPRMRAALEALGYDFEPEAYLPGAGVALRLKGGGIIGGQLAAAARVMSAMQPRINQQTGKPEEASARYKRGAGAVLDSMIQDMPVGRAASDTLSGVKDLTEGRFSGAGVARAAAARVVPGVVRETAQAMDAKRRVVDNQSGPGATFVDSLQSSVPGLRENMPARVTALGKASEQRNPFGLFRSLTPDKRVKALVDEGVGLPALKREEGESAAEYNARMQQFGAQTDRALDKIGNALADAPTEIRKKVLTDTLTKDGVKRVNILSEKSVQAELENDAKKLADWEKITADPRYKALDEEKKKNLRAKFSAVYSQYNAEVWKQKKEAQRAILIPDSVRRAAVKQAERAMR